MTRLDDLAAQRELDEAQRRAAWAPKGLKRQREAELRRLAHRLLRQDVSARRKGRRGK